MTVETLNSLPAEVAKAVRERILANSSAVPGGCWEWNLGRDRYGYARTKIRVDGRRWATCAHRASYLAFIGGIQRPLQVDHLCHNTICVNPAHLEAVTELENMRRRVGFGGADKCKRGHTRTAANTRVRVTSAGSPWYDCKDCAKITLAERKARSAS